MSAYIRLITAAELFAAAAAKAAEIYYYTEVRDEEIVACPVALTPDGGRLWDCNEVVELNDSRLANAKEIQRYQIF